MTSNAIHTEAQQLSALFPRAGMSQSAFAAAHSLGSRTMVWQYLHGHRPLNLRAASKFAIGLGVSIEQFSPRLAEEMRDVLRAAGVDATDGQLSQYVHIPCVDIVVRRGMEGFTVKPLLPASSFIAFRRDWLASRGYQVEHLHALQCSDDAMAPTIGVGDMVVINTADLELRDQRVFLVNYEGSLLIRRVFRDMGAWWLHCDQRDVERFPRKRLDVKQCYLLGRVVHRQSESL